MKKPKMKKISYFNYDECADYIAHKLGVKDLRNFADHKFEHPEPKNNPPYQDFWHYLIQYGLYSVIRYGPHDDCFFKIPLLPEHFSEEEKIMEHWQITIIKAFKEEFGEDAEYWAEW